MSIFGEGWNGECLEDYAPIRVLGVGNVLTGDDGMGPTIIAMLQAGWEERPDVSMIDVGTPGQGKNPIVLRQHLE